MKDPAQCPFCIRKKALSFMKSQCNRRSLIKSKVLEHVLSVLSENWCINAIFSVLTMVENFRLYSLNQEQKSPFVWQKYRVKLKCGEMAGLKCVIFSKLSQFCKRSLVICVAKFQKSYLWYRIQTRSEGFSNYTSEKLDFSPIWKWFHVENWCLNTVSNKLRHWFVF